MRFFNILFLCFLFAPGFAIGQKAGLPSSDSSKPNAKSSAGLDFYLNDLQKARKNMHYGNYEKVVYQKVCPYLESLSEHTQKLDRVKKQKILEEAVRIYDKALDFSKEHYLMYCLYNYYEATGADEIFQISKRLLSEKKQKQFQDMWAICDREEKEGNGDQVKSSTKKYKKSYLLPEKDYKNMSSASQLGYIKKVKKTFLQLEKTAKKTLSSAIEQKDRALLKFLNFFFIEYSRADLEVEDKCLIGGRIRELVYSNAHRRMVCPTYGNRCEGVKNSFQCGPVFNNQCIPNNPARTISQRCYEASLNKPVKPKEYKKYQSWFDRIATEYCTGKQARRAGCIYFAERMEQINSSAVKKPSRFIPLPKKKPPRPSQTEAGAVCTENCEKPNTEDIKTARTVLDAVKPPPTDEDIVKYFSDTLFGNVSCRCPGNDGCKRGCLPGDKIGKNESPPISKCRGTKDVKESTGNCMRHVTGAIMSAVHNMLAVYCNKTKNNQDYKQCNEDFGFPSDENNICRNGLVLPSALCALNLDGQSDQDFSKIEDRGVRQKCEKYNKLNSDLLSFRIMQDNGDIKEVPLFKKIDPKRLTEFQNDTSKIPEGAVIVAKSGSKHGHVEIKTGKKKCGQNKNQTCFCSDFCRERPTQYTESGIDVQAVFQWNPEIIKYAKELK